MSLRFRSHPQGLNRAIGYVGGVQDTPPATTANVAELLPSVPQTSNATCPTEWVSPSKGDLAGPLPWYKTIPGSADATEEAPGYIVVAGSGTDAYNLEIRGVFEFKTAVATANTPLEIKLAAERMAIRASRMALSQRAAMLHLLSTTPTGGSSGAPSFSPPGPMAGLPGL